MDTKIEPLPSSIQSWDVARVTEEIELRKGRAGELASIPADDLGPAERKELKVLNDELERLMDYSRVMAHPGHYSGGSSSRRKENRAEFGLLEGLGADFIKQVGTKALDGTTGGATMPGAWFDPRIRDLPQRRLFVRSLLPTRQVNTDRVEYLRQTVLTNNAAAVAAGALKPTSVITVARETAPIRVIAHISEALDRSILSDVDQLARFIDQQMRLGVLLEEEDQILA